MPHSRPASVRPPRALRHIQGVRHLPLHRVRWDRVGRISLLVTLAVVAGLYVQHTLAYLSTRAEANQQSAIVHQLERANRSLEAKQQSLYDPATIQRDARALGMVLPGERPYVVIGMQSH